MVCVAGVGSFVLADLYKVNPIWIFFAGNSILMIPLFAREFRTYWKKPSFMVFFAAWMATHGLAIVCLMRWTPIIYWPIGILVELCVGFLVAHWIFGVPFNSRE